MSDLLDGKIVEIENSNKRYCYACNISTNENKWTRISIKYLEDSKLTFIACPNCQTVRFVKEV